MNDLTLLLALGVVFVLIKALTDVVLLIDVIEDGMYRGEAPIEELEEIMRRDRVGNEKAENVEGTVAFIGGSTLDNDANKEN